MDIETRLREVFTEALDVDALETDLSGFSVARKPVGELASA